MLDETFGHFLYTCMSSESYLLTWATREAKTVGLALILLQFALLVKPQITSCPFIHCAYVRYRCILQQLYLASDMHHVLKFAFMSLCWTAGKG